MARGERRGFVAIDYLGEVYSLSRYIGVKVKEIKARLGDHSQLPPVKTTKAKIAEGMSAKLTEFIKEAEHDAGQRLSILEFHKKEMVTRQQEERKQLWNALENRWQAETRERVEVVLLFRPVSSQFKMDPGFIQAANLTGSTFLS